MISIDIANASDYGVGTKLLFNFGAYFPEVEGKVVGTHIEAATKFFPMAVYLVAEYEDPEQGASTMYITKLSELDKDKGVGVYLLEAKKAETKTESPWNKG